MTWQHLRGALLAAIAVLIVPGVVAPNAQGIDSSSEAVIVCRLPVTEHMHPVSHLQQPVQWISEARKGGEPSATFIVTYTGFPDGAEEAFQAAVDIWAQHITSSVPIEIEATWEDLGENVLGAAGPFIQRNFSAAPLSDTWYPTALANAMAGSDLNSSSPDIQASFNSNFDSWYFGTDGNPPEGSFELTTIVLHELAHGLGFIGSFMVANGRGTYEINGSSLIFDRLAEDQFGQSLLNASIYPNNSTQLAVALQDSVLFSGGTVVGTHEAPAPLFAPDEWSEGTSFAHYDEMTFEAGTANGLMTPFLVTQEIFRSPGPLACAALQDIGWTLAAPCADVVGEPENPPPVDPPNPSALYTFERVGPNPISVSTEFTLFVQNSQGVEVFLVDGVGRRVRTLLDRRTVGADSFTPIFLSSSGLPSGVYFLRVVGEEFDDVKSVVVVR